MTVLFRIDFQMSIPSEMAEMIQIMTKIEIKYSFWSNKSYTFI